MVTCYITGDRSESVDAFSTLGWIGGHAAPGFEPCVNPDPVFVLLGSCFDAMAQHSSHIGHKIADSLRRHRPGFCRRRRDRTGEAEDSGPDVAVSDPNRQHSPETCTVDLQAPPSYEAALTMDKPRSQTTESIFVHHDQQHRRQCHCQGHPPKYSVVEATRYGVEEQLCSCGEGTYTADPAPPPTYDQVISNSVICTEM